MLLNDGICTLLKEEGRLRAEGMESQDVPQGVGQSIPGCSLSFYCDKIYITQYLLFEYIHNVV